MRNHLLWWRVRAAFTGNVTSQFKEIKCLQGWLIDAPTINSCREVMVPLDFLIIKKTFDDPTA